MKAKDWLLENGYPEFMNMTRGNLEIILDKFVDEKLKQQQDQATIQAIDALTKQIAELMEKLKQERNKAIDECIAKVNKILIGHHYVTMELESLKDHE